MATQPKGKTPAKRTATKRTNTRTNGDAPQPDSGVVQLDPVRVLERYRSKVEEILGEPTSRLLFDAAVLEAQVHGEVVG